MSKAIVSYLGFDRYLVLVRVQIASNLARTSEFW